MCSGGEALEDAGTPPSHLAGRRVGVFLGASVTGYPGLQERDRTSINAYTNIGNRLCIITNRISYTLDLRVGVGDHRQLGWADAGYATSEFRGPAGSSRGPYTRAGVAPSKALFVRLVALLKKLKKISQYELSAMTVVLIDQFEAISTPPPHSLSGKLSCLIDRS